MKNDTTISFIAMIITVATFIIDKIGIWAYRKCYSNYNNIKKEIKLWLFINRTDILNNDISDLNMKEMQIIQSKLEVYFNDKQKLIVAIKNLMNAKTIKIIEIEFNNLIKIVK